jgi:hypothetical protein
MYVGVQVTKRNAKAVRKGVSFFMRTLFGRARKQELYSVYIESDNKRPIMDKLIQRNGLRVLFGRPRRFLRYLRQ